MFIKMGMLTYLPTYPITPVLATEIVNHKTEYPPCLILKQTRSELGLSQKALAMLLAQHGLGTFGSNFISRFECGLQKPWKGARDALCTALGMSEKELFPEILGDGKGEGR